MYIRKDVCDRDFTIEIPLNCKQTKRKLLIINENFSSLGKCCVVFVNLMMQPSFHMQNFKIQPTNSLLPIVIAIVVLL